MLAAFLVQSCVKEENYYQKPEDKVESDYFDFSTRKTVKLNLDYGFDGYSALCEVYVENPLNEEFVRDESIDAVYKVFTDDNTSFSGDVEVPSSADTLYVYSPTKGVKRLLKLPIENGTAAYLNQQESAAMTTRAAATTRVDLGKTPRVISSTYKFYSLYDNYFPYYGSYYWQPYNSSVPGLYTTVRTNTRLTAESTMGELMRRVDNALQKTDNSALVAPESAVNITVESTMPNGNPVSGAHLDLVFLDNNGNYHSSIAYYYYKTNSNLSGAQIKNLPKYFVLPRMTSGMPDAVIKTRLQFFGENGTEPGTDVFPAGYTVGWMIVSNMFPNDGGTYYWSGLSKIEERIKWAYGNNFTIYSNQSANYNQQPGCISLYDKKSQRIIVGFEDQAYNNLSNSDKSYEDVLFYVEADPIEAVINPDSPDIPVIDGGTGNEILVTEKTKGTLAFEDVWPTGGDYDMNDVIVEYESIVTFNNKNQIKKIEDIFRPVNKVNSAFNANAFGYVINSSLGVINLGESNLHKVEETNQIIVLPNVKDVAGQNKSYRVVREFSSPVNKVTYKRDYNPFIVINYKDGAKNRTEVHLPKTRATSWANPTLTGTLDDAFYVDKDGGFPFAIDIPVLNFEPVTEKEQIGGPGEYPKFTTWAESFGKKNTDWYKNKQ